MKNTIATEIATRVESSNDSDLRFSISETTKGRVDLFTLAVDVAKIVSLYQYEGEEAFLKIVDDKHFDPQQLSFDEIAIILQELNCCKETVEAISTAFVNATRVSLSTICEILSRGRRDNVIREDSYFATVAMIDIDLYSKTETANLLKKSNRTIERMLKSGELKGAKHGRKWQITKESIVELLNKYEKLRGVYR